MRKQIYSSLILTPLLLSWAVASASVSSHKTHKKVGKSTMKLSQPVANPQHEARQELLKIDQQIKDLDRQIADTNTQTMIFRNSPGSSPGQVSSLESQASAFEAQKAELQADRDKLASELQSQQN